MKVIFSILIPICALILLMNARAFVNLNSLNLNLNPFITNQLIHQILALGIALLVVLLIVWMYPESVKYLSLGNLQIIASKESWLGINGKTSWFHNGLSLLIFVSLATSIFMFIALKNADALFNFQIKFLPFIILFSFTNSLAEELIFRFGIVGGIGNHFSLGLTILFSAVLFGLPHFSGWPNGFIGVLMAGLLGFILCKATIETQGLGIAWIIHFVQDIIIFTALFMLKNNEF